MSPVLALEWCGVVLVGGLVLALVILAVGGAAKHVDKNG